MSYGFKGYLIIFFKTSLNIQKLKTKIIIDEDTVYLEIMGLGSI